MNQLDFMLNLMSQNILFLKIKNYTSMYIYITYIEYIIYTCYMNKNEYNFTLLSWPSTRHIVVHCIFFFQSIFSTVKYID